MVKDSVTKIWIRNDDVSVCDENYRQITQLYKKYGITTILCMIPTVIDIDCCRLLDGYDNFIISQHGFSHKNYKKKFNLDYSVELCDKRGTDVVVEQILSGKRKLEDFSQRPVSILTPPFNKIDKAIEIELSKYYFALSTFGDNKSCFPKDINPSIDIINWKVRVFDREHFKYKLQQQIGKRDSIGICIHHNFLTSDDIKFLDESFDELSRNNDVVLSRRLL